MFDFRGKAKWQAWKDLSDTGLSQEEAKAQYVAEQQRQMSTYE